VPNSDMAAEQVRTALPVAAMLGLKPRHPLAGSHFFGNCSRRSPPRRLNGRLQDFQQDREGVFQAGEAGTIKV
jgi:hypothetical protein